MNRRRGFAPPSAGLAALALAPLALLWPALRHLVEARMAVHMLGEFPVLLAAGWAGSRLCRRHPRGTRLLHGTRLLDWRGWTSATFVTGVALVWMLPSTLDAALVLPGVAAGKVASWWVAGWLLADGWRRMDPEVLVFFAGNLAWMSATAGMLYLDAPARLCVNYLRDDQAHAGIGLVLLACAIGALALRSALRPRPTDRPVDMSHDRRADTGT